MEENLQPRAPCNRQRRKCISGCFERIVSAEEMFKSDNLAMSELDTDFSPNNFERDYRVCYLANNNNNQYFINISRYPSCTCDDFKNKYTNQVQKTKRIVCKHIVFVLMYNYGLLKNNDLLHQAIFTDNDLIELFNIEDHFNEFGFN